ncbi:hypothetical protein [Streptomyces regalis]|uniref:Uncharacterized protein n=1 Tax=Streptomyces regalis TaxID=68262 RepID=A0A124G788_9ACTN|nr:hypothetical protein [Streptomyces regalis]KUL22076.1 hypothetical protein ADL12_43340 [Streptomyces regalis]
MDPNASDDTPQIVALIRGALEPGDESRKFASPLFRAARLAEKRIRTAQSDDDVLRYAWLRGTALHPLAVIWAHFGKPTVSMAHAQPALASYDYVRLSGFALPRELVIPHIGLSEEAVAQAEHPSAKLPVLAHADLNARFALLLARHAKYDDPGRPYRRGVPRLPSPSPYAGLWLPREVLQRMQDVNETVRDLDVPLFDKSRIHDVLFKAGAALKERLDGDLSGRRRR